MTKNVPGGPPAAVRSHRRIDWVHYTAVIVVFGITGSLSALFGRFLLNWVLGVEGEVWSGPWSYRIAYFMLVPPIYSVILVAVGSLFGKRCYFKRRVLRMWGRLLPMPVFHRSIGVGRKLLPHRLRPGISQ